MDGSLSARLTDGQNTLANPASEKLPTELLAEIFKQARPDDKSDAYTNNHPTALAGVCRQWRGAALSTAALWSSIFIIENSAEERKAARINLERSGETAPLFLTWFSMAEQFDADPQNVMNEFIIPYCNRWQRITLFTNEGDLADKLNAVMRTLDFEVLQDLEIFCTSSRLSPSGPTLCLSAPLLHRCRLMEVPSLPPLPSNLVVLDCQLTMGRERFNLDPLLEFLPHVAHSLEHLRFGLPIPDVSATPRQLRITLQNLKTLLICNSHNIMKHILAPNLTYFDASYYIEPDMQEVARMFYGFTAPKLQSIRFSDTPLRPLLNLNHLPSMFPQLKSVVFKGCGDESAFINFLEPPKDQEAENPFPKLEELAISNLADWTSLQAAIEKRLENGDQSLRMIHLPKGDETGPIMGQLTNWLPKQGIEPVLYEPRQLRMPTPPEFQDDFFDEESHLFAMIRERLEDEMEGIEEDDN